MCNLTLAEGQPACTHKPSHVHSILTLRGCSAQYALYRFYMTVMTSSSWKALYTCTYGLMIALACFLPASAAANQLSSPLVRPGSTYQSESAAYQTDHAAIRLWLALGSTCVIPRTSMQRPSDDSRHTSPLLLWQGHTEVYMNVCQAAMYASGALNHYSVTHSRPLDL